MMSGIGFALFAIGIGFLAWADSIAAATSARPYMVLILSVLAGMFLAGGLILIRMWFPYEYSLQYEPVPRQKPLPLRDERPPFRWRHLLAFWRVIPLGAIGTLLFLVLWIGFMGTMIGNVILGKRLPAPLSTSREQIIHDYLKDATESAPTLPIRFQIDRDDSAASIALTNSLERAFSGSGAVEIHPPTVNAAQMTVPRGIGLVSEPDEYSSGRILLALDRVGIDAKLVTDYDMHKSKYVLITLRNKWF